MESSLVFGIAVFSEKATQLEWCLKQLRDAYPSPETPVFVIDDGSKNEDYAQVCGQYRADFIKGIRLKVVGKGCQWWQRFFTTALRYSTNYCVKMDPDTQIHRSFNYFPESVDVFGTVERACDIQGGLQGFTRDAVERILSSELCLDPIYTNVDSWGGDMTRQYTHNTGQISTDHSLAHIVERLKLRWGDWREVDCQWRRSRAFREGVAATHPHKVS